MKTSSYNVIGVLGLAFAAVLALGLLIGLYSGSGSEPEQNIPETPLAEEQESQWCADADWLRQAAWLIQETYGEDRDVTPDLVRLGMEYGSGLRYNYNVHVQWGRLPAGIEDRLTDWGVYLATQGPVTTFDETAARVIAGCRGGKSVS